MSKRQKIKENFRFRFRSNIKEPLDSIVMSKFDPVQCEQALTTKTIVVVLNVINIISQVLNKYAIDMIQIT